MKRNVLIVCILILSIILISSTVALCNGLADSPWPRYKGDIRNAGRSAYKGTRSAELKWSFDTGAPISSGPVIGHDGTIYIANEKGDLFAFNPDTFLKWKVSINATVLSSPTLGADGTIYIGTYVSSGNLFAFNPDGTMRWKVPMGAVYGSPNIADDGTIYVASYDSKLYAIMPDGTIKWTFTADKGIPSSVAIDEEGQLYFGTESGTVYVVDKNGQLVKTKNLGSTKIRGSVTLGDDGTIYVGTDLYRLYALESDTLDEKWSFRVLGGSGSYPHSGPSIGYDGNIYFGARDKNLYALNPQTGKLIWEAPFTASNQIVFSQPVIDIEGSIYFGARDGLLYAVKSDGTLKWSFPTNGAIDDSTPAIGKDGTVYIGSRDGSIYAIRDSSEPIDEPPTLTGGIIIGSPNPFTKEDTVKMVFSLEEVASFKAQIYDVSGKIVRTLPFTPIESGYNEVEWDGKDERGIPVSGGIYICVVFKESDNDIKVIAEGRFLKVG